MLPGVDRAGLWRVCYDKDRPDAGGSVISPTSGTAATVQLLSSSTGDTASVVNGAPEATAAPAASVAAAPRRAAVVEGEGKGEEEDNSDRLTNASKVVRDIKEDLTNNLPFTKKSSKGCTDDVSSFYSDVWGQDFDDRLQAVRALTLAFAFCGALKVLSLLFYTMCCGCTGGGGGDGYDDGSRDGRRGSGGCGGLGWLTTLQVLAGWAGWLVFLWILLDIRGNQTTHELAEAAGIQIDTSAAKRVESYWGHSFWLFLAATLVTTIGGMFRCC